MKKFSTYLNEQMRLTDLAGVQNALDQYKRDGEILNPDYKNLVDNVRRVLRNDTKQGRDLILNFFHTGGEETRSVEGLDDIYYGWPDDSLASIGSFEKKMVKFVKYKHDPKFSTQLKGIIDAGNNLIKTWKPIVQDIKDLKSKVVKVTTKRAEAKAVAQKQMAAKFSDSSSLIKIFESHLEEYKKMAETRAKEFIKDKLAVLKKAGWDLNKVAPYPRSTSGNYQQQLALHQFYSSITSPNVLGARSPKDPDIRKENTSLTKRYIDMNVKAAEESYRGFMQKMISKIGKPVVDASMTGSIWTGATLSVTTNDGEKQVWHTQMILNFSKYQKMFNQFPSRRKK